MYAYETQKVVYAYSNGSKKTMQEAFHFEAG